ncbi:hypothetical protein E5K00_03735 [Hymenobacter aquaticus]|uniref:Uncharacterized protein n=1 Tax=Hymenobacter aquaticus TaxID=1867101 RepID=A0A4Z0Q2S8_9BACT|nr:hypothetical protein [Hymenobacter aquaticus]TGE24337.1 hypothetical protein E5K00_03735 [Hymenobacter aquaticus]
MKQLLLPTLLLLSFSASSQAIKPAPKTVTLSVTQAAKIEDSLRVLPLLRQEARQWRLAAADYQGAADSLQRAGRLQQDAARSYQKSLDDQQRLLASETAEKTLWQGKARKRGLLNGLLIALSSGLVLLAAVR